MTEYIAKDNDFTEFEENKDLTFVREDRNGSRYYSTDICPKCGGTGYLPEYDYVEDGVCFMCLGTGHCTTEVKVITESYNKKMAERRLAKLRKQAGTKNEQFKSKFGFDADCRTWVVLGNTYEIKDELKAAGAKFTNKFGWVFPFEQSEYPTIEIDKDTVIDEKYYFDPSWEDDLPEARTLVETDTNGLMEFSTGVNIDRWLRDLKRAKELELKAESGRASEYVGEIGDHIEVEVKLLRINWFETHYSYYGESVAVYTMEDEDGNMYVWKTGACPDEMVQGAIILVKGTVKNHSEYNGQKQTELTRCRVSECKIRQSA